MKVKSLPVDDGRLSTMLNGVAVGYRLVRTRRRTIGLVIDDEGLTVRASARTTKRDINAALHEKADWILRTLAKWVGRERRLPIQEWRNGATVLYRGESLPMIVATAKQPRVEADLFGLSVRLRSISAQSIQTAVERWLQLRSREIFRHRLDYYSAQLRLAPPVAKFTRARTQWGSCNAKGVIRLHWRLVQLPPGLADYVVAHEVAHRLELNHSARFWTTVERIYPDYKSARVELAPYGELLD